LSARAHDKRREKGGGMRACCSSLCAHA
jgi:hypothetical protein